MIELSLVLVIIGFIVGGVLAGKALVTAASIRSTVSQIERYNTAAHTFQSKFNCLPGDCGHAVSVGLAGSGDERGDGDGNSSISGAFTGISISPGDFFDEPREAFNFWYHLSQSNLIAGSHAGYPGTGAGVTTWNEAPGKYFPETASGVGVWISDNAGKPIATRNTFFLIASLDGKAGMEGVYYGGLTPIVNFQIDSKLDDGHPATGTVLAGNYRYFDVISELSAAEIESDVGGPAATDVCVNTDTVPSSYNVNNVSGLEETLCILSIRAAF